MNTDHETHEEAARMESAGMIRISPEKLEEMIHDLGYKLGESFCYRNRLNGTAYNAKSVNIMSRQSGKCFSHIDSPKDRLAELQEIRQNYFVLSAGRIWEI